MFPKPKDKKQSRPGIKVHADGREVCTTDSQWRKRRWELYCAAEEVCFKCGCKLEFGATAPFASGNDDGMTNFHAHHSRGTRGLGGAYRDDRIHVPFTGTEKEWNEFLEELWREYPFLPPPPFMMKWNLYALCNNCHKDDHNQGCKGELQWSRSQH